MYFVGLFTDLIIQWRLMPQPNDIVGQYILLFLSIFLIGVASYLYLRVQLGAGPRDGLMVGLVKKLNKPVWLVRCVIEVAVLLIGYFLGGPIGVGTVVAALGIGYSVQLAFRIGKFDAKSPQMNLWELIRHLKQ
jgi:uncharacterized membrane protein YczE